MKVLTLLRRRQHAANWRPVLCVFFCFDDSFLSFTSRVMRIQRGSVSDPRSLLEHGTVHMALLPINRGLPLP